MVVPQDHADDVSEHTADTAVGTTDEEETVRRINWRVELSKAQSEEEVLKILELKRSSTTPLREVDCLFCSHEGATFEKTMAHMARAHSFFIPDVDYLVDVHGLIAYLGKKIAINNMCIYCNGKGRSFYSLEAVRKHMSEKGHCKILYENGGEMEVSDFYDFSSTYEDYDNDGVLMLEDGEGDEEWEDVDGEDIEEGESSETAVQSTVKKTRTTKMRRAPELTEDETEMILPSGAVIGHRDYNVYWKQNINVNSPYANMNKQLVKQIAGSYSVLGYHNNSSLEVKREVHRKQMLARKELYKQNVYKARIGENANKLQKYYRCQIGFGA